MTSRSFILFALLLAQALLSGCAWSVCSDGNLSATVESDNGDLTALSLSGDYSLGTLANPNPGLANCTNIGGLKFIGGISTLAPFAGVVNLGQLFIADGVSTTALTGLPNMRTLGSLVVRGHVEDLNVFSSLEVAGNLSFDSGRASFVAPNLTRASSLTGGSVHTLSAPLLEELEFGIQLTFGDVSSLEGLPSLRYLGGDLELLGLDIEEIHLDALEEVEGNVNIGGHRFLATWNGMVALTTVSGNFSVGNNPMLSSADVLASLVGVDVGGFVRVCQNFSTEEAPDDCPDFPAQQ